MPQEITKFEKILNKFYDRIEKDEDFFSYYNIDVSEAIQIAQTRATNYLCEALDELSCLSNLDVDFSDYDEDVQQIGFKLLPKEIKLVVEIMFLIYMKRDESLLHAMEINFTPSDLSVFSPGNERTSYRNFIAKLEHDVSIKIDDYKNRDRKTNALKQFINYAQYEEDGSTYRIWVENLKSLELKMQKVQQYGIAGAAFWKLGLETSDVWPMIGRYLRR